MTDHLQCSPADVSDPFDVAIRGGPDQVPGHVAQPFLTERRLPVCSPALLARVPLRRVQDLRQHTLLHAATLPEVWPQWLLAAGVPDLEPQNSVTLEHFYLTLQAALDGLGVAIGPERLVADDVAEGRLAKPFAGPLLPARSYHTYVPEARVRDPAALAFCDWLRGAAAAANSAQRSTVKATPDAAMPLHLLGAYTGQY